MRHFSISEPVFNRLTVVFVGTKEELDKWTKRKYGTTVSLGENQQYDGGCALLKSDKGNTFQLVWLESFSSKPLEVVPLCRMHHVAVHKGKL